MGQATLRRCITKLTVNVVKRLLSSYMIHILQTVRISSIKSFVLVNSVRKMMSPIFFFVPRSKYWKRKTSLFILPPSWWFIIFSIWHIRLSILLIQAVCGNSLAQLGVSVAQLQNIRARRSEVRLLATQHFFFFPCLWPDRKNFSHVSIQNKWAIRNYHIFFLWFRGYRILQQLIGSCISLFSDVNINFLGTLSGCLNRANKEIVVHTEVLKT